MLCDACGKLKARNRLPHYNELPIRPQTPVLDGVVVHVAGQQNRAELAGSGCTTTMHLVEINPNRSPARTILGISTSLGQRSRLVGGPVMSTHAACWRVSRGMIQSIQLPQLPCTDPVRSAETTRQRSPFSLCSCARERRAPIPASREADRSPRAAWAALRLLTTSPIPFW